MIHDWTLWVISVEQTFQNVFCLEIFFEPILDQVGWDWRNLHEPSSATVPLVRHQLLVGTPIVVNVCGKVGYLT